MIYRRTFLRGLAALGALPLAGLPGRADAAADSTGTLRWPKENDPDYWPWIRRQFSIPPGEAYFNTGTLGACPRLVIDAVIDSLREVEDSMITRYDYRPEHREYIAGYRPELELRKKAGAVINAGPNEIALVQNATMGINFIANGLDLNAGDEVLLTDQEHVGAMGPWDLRAKRQGMVVKKLPVPVPTPNPETIVNTFSEAITSRTRVVAVPHITSRYGIVLPVRRICELGRRRGIFTFVDGAQAVGQLRVDVKEIGCDAYATSPHKWLLAPPGNGLLYVREERAKEVWATLASAQWNNEADHGFRLMQFGTGNLSLLAGLEAALDFYQRIGPEKIERRIIGLADRLRGGLQKIKGATVLSPTHPALACAIVTYSVSGWKALPLQDELWDRKKIRVRAQGEDSVRQSVHIYNSEEEIDSTLEIVRALASR